MDSHLVERVRTKRADQVGDAWPVASGKGDMSVEGSWVEVRADRGNCCRALQFFAPGLQFRQLYRPENLELAAVLRDIREATGQTQTQFAGRLGRGQTYVSKWAAFDGG